MQSFKGKIPFFLPIIRKKKGFRHYYFHMIKKPAVLDEYFDKDENFNLEEYLSRSFGIF